MRKSVGYKKKSNPQMKKKGGEGRGKLLGNIHRGNTPRRIDVKEYEPASLVPRRRQRAHINVQLIG